LRGKISKGCDIEKKQERGKIFHATNAKVHLDLRREKKSIFISRRSREERKTRKRAEMKHFETMKIV
jgi:hypothetical protein